MEVFAARFGVEAAVAVALERRGAGSIRRWWTRSARCAGTATSVAAVLGPRAARAPAALEPEEDVRMVDDATLDLIAEAFARVIDAKSPYTYRHSEGWRRWR